MHKPTDSFWLQSKGLQWVLSDATHALVYERKGDLELQDTFPNAVVYLLRLAKYLLLVQLVLIHLGVRRILIH